MRKSRLEALSRDEFLDIVTKNGTMSDILKAVGLSIKGTGNYSTLKKMLKKHGIDRDLLSRNASKRRSDFWKTFRTKKPLKDVMTIDSSYNRNHLKVRLLEDGLLREVCYICGQKSVWNGKKLVLQLDHINGVYNDNRLENLRLVCPNCHSQTESFSGKCFKKIKKRNGGKIPRPWSRKVKNRPSRKDLIELVKQTNYSSVGRIYGVSGNAVKKWINNPYDIVTQ